jgi:uncharacterized protein (TIGR03086 family)
VLGHVLAIQDYYVCVIDGRPPTMNPMVDPDRHAGADPIGAWATARDAVLRALDRPGVLDRVVSTMQGDQRVDDMIAFNVADTTVHSWDLARALGVDDTLDPALVTRSLEVAGGTMTVPADVPDDRTRLLATFGRRVTG